MMIKEKDIEADDYRAIKAESDGRIKSLHFAFPQKIIISIS